MTALTQAEVRRLLDYEPSTGVFTWKRREDRSVQWNGRFAGAIAGGSHHDGGSGFRWRICVNYRRYKAHRLAFLYMAGRWPTDEIDHIDGNGLNNAFSNLREATSSQNSANMKLRSDNTSGYKRASCWPSKKNPKKFQAHISVNGKQKHLGLFETAEEAHLAYSAAARQHFGEFARMR